MKRRRKNYRLAVPPVRLLGKPGNLVVNFLDGAGGLEQSFDFAVHGRRPVMAEELAFAFRHHLADKSPITRRGVFTHGVRAWFRFLDDHDASANSVTQMAAVDTGVIKAFIVWLERRSIGKGSQYSAWSAFKQLAAWLQRHRPDLVDPELELPFNAFPRKNAETKRHHALSQAEFDAVLAAARTDIDTSWATFEAGREALARADRPAIAAELDLRRLDLDDLSVLLAIICDRYGGIVPPQSVTLEQGTGLWRLQFAIGDRGGCGGLAPNLHATPETLVPYMIAIAAQTYANPEALRLMRRDCMSEHVLLDRRIVVSWTKGRSNRPQRRSFLRDRSLSVPNLIDRVLELTAGLVPHAPEKDRDRLFLCGGVAGSRRVGVIPDYLMAKHVRLFAERHGLRDDCGGALALRMVGLRSTGLTLAHAALGHDLLKTQALANHASLDTTRLYVDRPVVRAAQAVELGRLQARFVEVVRSGSLDERPTRKNSRGSAPRIDTRNATASGFECADPLAGIAPGQKAGQPCTAWLGCFTCPNAVIPLEADTLAQLLQMRAALSGAKSGMSPDRWRVLYAPKLEILERDVLPRFPAALHAMASAQIPAAPAIPPIE